MALKPVANLLDSQAQATNSEVVADKLFGDIVEAAQLVRQAKAQGMPASSEEFCKNLGMLSLIFKVANGKAKDEVSAESLEAVWLLWIESLASAL